MPRRDFFHAPIRAALEKDGWTITADPMQIVWQGQRFNPDLGAERLLAAEKGAEKIAVEIKSFLGQNFTFDFYEALGQFDNYFFALADLEPDRKVMLAVSQKAYNTFFSKKYVQRLLELKTIPILVVDTDTQTIVQWIK